MYEEAFQSRVVELKDKIKSLKKALRVKDITSTEKMHLNNRIERFEQLIKTFNVKKLKLRELPNGQVVNVLILDKFIAKLKKKFDYQLVNTEEGLLLKYWNTGHSYEKPTGLLTFSDLSHHYINYDVPYLEREYLLGKVQAA